MVTKAGEEFYAFLIVLTQSARGLAHSKTWRKLLGPVSRTGVLECTSSLALSRCVTCREFLTHTPEPLIL